MASDFPTALVSLCVPPAPGAIRGREKPREGYLGVPAVPAPVGMEPSGRTPVLTWDRSQQDFWLSKLCFLPSIDDVAHHGQLAPTTQLGQGRKRGGKRGKGLRIQA